MVRPLQEADEDPPMFTTTSTRFRRPRRRALNKAPAPARPCARPAAEQASILMDEFEPGYGRRIVRKKTVGVRMRLKTLVPRAGAYLYPYLATRPRLQHGPVLPWANVSHEHTREYLQLLLRRRLKGLALLVLVNCLHPAGVEQNLLLLRVQNFVCITDLSR